MLSEVESYIFQSKPENAGPCMFTVDPPESNGDGIDELEEFPSVRPAAIVRGENGELSRVSELLEYQLESSCPESCKFVE